MERHDDFICICKQAGKAEADALMQEVYSRLSRGSEELQAVTVGPENLLSSVVVSLNWDYGAHITGIGNDMWSGVYAETYNKDDEGNPVFSTFIQCDFVEHGIAATWKAFADKFPEGSQED